MKDILMKDFDWQVKFDVFPWQRERLNATLKFLICSLDFPINLHTAYYNYVIITIWNIFVQILTDGFLDNQ